MSTINAILLPKNKLITLGASFIFVLFGLVVLSISLPIQVSALSGAEFKAGRIIDDSVFTNKNAMTTQQIQAFLDSKMPVCDTNGTKPSGRAGYPTRADWGAANGNPAPYICLKDYRQDVPEVINSGSNLCTGSISAGNKSAAQIIYEVSQACGVNPQTLIVLLQKEQSLVTDDWPWPGQYRSATGYGCPDTAPCDTEFYGYFNQVYQAAKAFKRYAANPANYNYRAGRNNTILYNPNAACGSSTVYIENQSTANLYIYTPYQPNQAALNNLYGTGDGCSAYGNRNFWRIFNDWFGPTYAPKYGALTNGATSTIDTNTMVQGDKAFVTFRVQNMGKTTWYKANTNLAAAEPIERLSGFSDSTWSSTSRAAQLKEVSVASGEYGTFEFWYTAPTRLMGTFTEKFTVVIEGSAWVPYFGLHLTTNVVPANYTSKLVGLASFKDANASVGRDTLAMAPGESAYIIANVKNEGNRVWRNDGSNPTRLGTANNLDRASGFNDGSWLSPARATTMEQHTVAPGDIATFKFWYKAPPVYGTHRESFRIVQEGITWSNDIGLGLNTTIAQPKYSAATSAMYSTEPTHIMTKGAKSLVTVVIKNTSNTTWIKANTNLAATEPIDRRSGFSDETWLSSSRAAQLKEATVAPGGNGTFEFWFTAPTYLSSGTYTEKFSVVIEGAAWIPYFGLNLTTKIN